MALFKVSVFLVSIDTWVVFDAHQVPGVIVVVTYVAFINHFETNFIADILIKIVAGRDHVVPLSRSELSFPLDILFLLRLGCLAIVSKVVGMLLARTLVLLLHAIFTGKIL